jgi:hypothetical protein
MYDVRRLSHELFTSSRWGIFDAYSELNQSGYINPPASLVLPHTLRIVKRSRGWIWYNRKSVDIEKIYTICFFVYKNTIQDRFSLK